jgi:hypothetical protein
MKLSGRYSCSCVVQIISYPIEVGLVWYLQVFEKSAVRFPLRQTSHISITAPIMKRGVEVICTNNSSGHVCGVNTLRNSGVVLEPGDLPDRDEVGEFASPAKRARDLLPVELQSENVGLHATIAVLTQQLAQTEQELLDLKKRFKLAHTTGDINRQYAKIHKELHERCAEEMLAFSRSCEQAVTEQREVAKLFESEVAALQKNMRDQQAASERELRAVRRRMQQEHSAALEKQAEEAAAMQSSTEAKCEQHIDQVVQDCMQQVKAAQLCSECKQKRAAMEQQLQQQHVSTAQLNGQGENSVPAAPPVSQPVEHPSSEGKQAIRRAPAARVEQLQSNSAVPRTHRINQVLRAFQNLLCLSVSPLVLYCNAQQLSAQLNH